MKKKEALTLEDIRESVADTRTNYIERYGEDVLGSLTEAAQTGHILLAEVERLEASYVSRPVALMMLAALDRAGFGAVGRDNDLGSMTRQVCEEVTRLRAEVERRRHAACARLHDGGGMKQLTLDQTDLLRIIHRRGPLLGEVQSWCWQTRLWSHESTTRRVKTLVRRGMLTLVRKPANDSTKWRVCLTQTGQDFAMVEEGS